MQRDMSKIKTILLFLEKDSAAGSLKLNAETFNWPEDEFFYHCRLIIEKELAVGRCFDDGSCVFNGITWAGHDFLDNARNSDVWSATMNAAGRLSFGVFQKVLEAAATQFALKQLGM